MVPCSLSAFNFFNLVPWCLCGEKEFAEPRRHEDTKGVDSSRIGSFEQFYA
jgi:hypothetical protein